MAAAIKTKKGLNVDFNGWHAIALMMRSLVSKGSLTA